MSMDQSSIKAISTCMSTLRSVRGFLPTQVPVELIDFVLYHATLAGSAKNRQPWRFIVVAEPARCQRLRSWYHKTWARHAARVRELDPSAPEPVPTGVAAFATAPAYIVVCFLPVPRNPADFFGGASLFPAVQNLLLGARCVGLGTTLTTVQAIDAFEPSTTKATDQLREILHIPDSALPAGVVAIGYPRTPFRPVRHRLPVAEVTFSEQWGQQWIP